MNKKTFTNIYLWVYIFCVITASVLLFILINVTDFVEEAKYQKKEFCSNEFISDKLYCPDTFLEETKYPDRRVLYCDESKVVWTKSTGQSMQPYSFNEPRPYMTVDINDIKAGDPIIYLHPHKNITVHHSVLFVFNDSVQTFGYNNLFPDDYVVPFDNVLYVGCLFGVPDSFR